MLIINRNTEEHLEKNTVFRRIPLSIYIRMNIIIIKNTGTPEHRIYKVRAQGQNTISNILIFFKNFKTFEFCGNFVFGVFRCSGVLLDYM